MNVKQWAAQGGVHPLPAYRWFRVGKLPVAQVSSADQRTDLDRQVARVTAWVTRDGGQVDQMVTEIGSALNGRHRKFLTLLCDPTADRIVVEHRDRFARFGAEYVEPADDLVRSPPCPVASTYPIGGVWTASFVTCAGSSERAPAVADLTDGPESSRPFDGARPGSAPTASIPEWRTCAATTPTSSRPAWSAGSTPS